MLREEKERTGNENGSNVNMNGPSGSGALFRWISIPAWSGLIVVCYGLQVAATDLRKVERLNGSGR
jgi:hypothetical protein